MTKGHPKAGENLPADGEKIDKVNRVVDDLLETQAYQVETLQWQETQLAKLKVTNASLQEAVAWRESQVKALNKSEDYLKAEIDQLERAIASNVQALAWRGEQVEELERELVSLGEALLWRGEQVVQLKRDIEYLQERHEAVLAELRSQLRNVSSQLENTVGSTGWKFVLWVRQIRDRALPVRSQRHRAYEKLMTRVRSHLGG